MLAQTPKHRPKQSFYDENDHDPRAVQFNLGLSIVMSRNSGPISVVIGGSSTKYNSQNPTVGLYAVCFTFEPSILACKAVLCLASCYTRR